MGTSFRTIIVTVSLWWLPHILCILCRCFPRSWPFYFGILTPFGVIYTFNLVIFFIIIFTVLRHGNNNDTKVKKIKKIRKKATITIVLLVMFGVGWIFGVLGGVTDIQPISIPFQVLFIAIAGFHGVLMFLFHPFRSKDAHEEWKKWLYYITCRKGELNSSRKQSTAKISDQSATRHRNNQTLTTSASSMAERFGYGHGSQDSSITLASVKTSRLGVYPIAEESSLYSVAEESSSTSDQATEDVKMQSARPGIYVFNKDDMLLTFGNETALSDWMDSDLDNSDLIFSRSPSSVLLKNMSNDKGSKVGQDSGIHDNDDEEYVVYYNFEDDDM